MVNMFTYFSQEKQLLIKIKIMLNLRERSSLFISWESGQKSGLAKKSARFDIFQPIIFFSKSLKNVKKCKKIQKKFEIFRGDRKN